MLELSQQKRVFELLPDNTTKAEMLSELDEHLIAPLLEQFAEAELTAILLEMSDDDQADFLAAASERKTRTTHGGSETRRCRRC